MAEPQAPAAYDAGKDSRALRLITEIQAAMLRLRLFGKLQATSSPLCVRWPEQPRG